jgi:Aconitase family (aconitate hydratase)
VTSKDSVNSFGARDTLKVGDKSYQIYRLAAVPNTEKLPYSLKVLAENLLRNEDGSNITKDHIEAIANWDPKAKPSIEIQYTPARVVMQDFTGVPCIVDLATMREAIGDLGGNPDKVNPLAPAGPTPSSATSRSSTSATASATSSCVGGKAHSTTSRWCRRAPASCTRSTSNTWRKW